MSRAVKLYSDHLLDTQFTPTINLVIDIAAAYKYKSILAILSYT